jgi:hypothetical protein
MLLPTAGCTNAERKRREFSSDHHGRGGATP